MTEKIRHFIDLDYFSKIDFRNLLNSCHQRKNSKIRNGKAEIDNDASAQDKILAMIFEKPSTRTRISFNIAVKQLGGSSITLNPDGSHYGKGDETLKDTAKVLSQYGDLIMIRTKSHSNLVEFAKHSEIPLINGLSELSHPCQVMSDIFTIEEKKGSIEDKKIAWIGDGNNNMAYSLIEAATILNFELRFGCPKKYSPDKKILNWAKKIKLKLKFLRIQKKLLI